ncbi:MAG: sulfotransferase [Bryobacteraceae bacterium]
MPPRTPNFFIAGAPKAGTDALYYDLDQHPDIYMSPLKEPCYFSSEIRVGAFEANLQKRMRKEAEATREYIAGPIREKRFGGIISEWEDYLRLFAGAKHEKRIGEGSVTYLWSKTAAAAIASRIPDARILIVLRNPAERAFAQYLKSVSDGTVACSFGQHLQACFSHSKECLGLLHPFLEYGMYGEQIARYLTVFPREQISISIFEEIAVNPSKWLADICESLGVSTAFSPDYGRGHYRPNVPRLVRLTQAAQRCGAWDIASRCIPKQLKTPIKHAVYRQPQSLKMEPENREFLRGYYRDDIRHLEDLLKKDLSIWLR